MVYDSPEESFLFEKGGNNMSRLCWVFVLVAVVVVVVVTCDARPRNCEQEGALARRSRLGWRFPKQGKATLPQLRRRKREFL
ncbi:hypothetical protein JTE90_026923 [Oedothorax gibbosus]|uniref:Uncharacterized protein n=1 Tax=Oedothorax gibbosus TaxID=931172 RepID=A0AAV6TLS7_9ARAC|nr:hypothetical protein JTE90_026923 [Oedothorax gibbosus]